MPHIGLHLRQRDAPHMPSQRMGIIKNPNYNYQDQNGAGCSYSFNGAGNDGNYPSKSSPKNLPVGMRSKPRPFDEPD
jgi:hypothetical protein